MESIAPRAPAAAAATENAGGRRGEVTPPLAPLAAIVALAAVLACAAMWGRVLLDDEVGTWVAVGRGYVEITTRFEEWLTQPAYFLLAKPFSALLGPGELAIRLPALLASLSGLVALAWLGARLVRVRVGLLAALLLALQPYSLFYAQMARGYTLAATLSTISLLLMLALAGGAGWATGVAYVIARALGVYTHLGACGSGLAELAVVICVAGPRGGPALRRTFTWLAAGALASGALYLPLWGDLLRFRESWSAGGFGWGFLPLVLSAYAGGPGLPVVVWLAALVAGCGLAWRDSRVAGPCLVLWPLGVLAFYVATGTAHYPWAFARFLFPALPAFALAIAVALDALARRAEGFAGRAALPVVVAVFLAATAFKTPAIAFGPRDTDWPAVIARLEAAGVRARDAFVLPLRFNAFPHYLADREGASLESRGPARLDSLLRDHGTSALAGRRLAFLVDLVDLDASSVGGHFEVERFGPTTLLLARPELGRDEVSAVTATRVLLEQVVAQREALPRGPIRSDWVYWRIDRRHEHAFLPEIDLAIDWALIARLARAQGDGATAARARARVAELRREIRLPGEVRASWSLLAPDWDGIR